MSAKYLITQDRKNLVIRNDDFSFISLITRKAKSAVLNASVVKLLHIYISLKCFHL